uniref:RNase H type-1 domain-containing protein n=1 Tax=Fervidobacterium pennivorans TaxID=93466 RepID=A0A7C4WB95_FERPE
MDRPIEIYVDGAFKGGLIAYGYVIHNSDCSKAIDVQVKRPTTHFQNVEAEITAVLEALRHIYRNYWTTNTGKIILYYDLNLIKDIIYNRKLQLKNPYHENYATEFRTLEEHLRCEVIFKKVTNNPVHKYIDEEIRKKLNSVLKNKLQSL